MSSCGRVQGDPARQPREEAGHEVVGVQRKALVPDANILIRTVVGQRVRNSWRRRSSSVETRQKALAALKAMAALATSVGVYGEVEAEARKRLGTRSGGLADSGSGPCS